MGGYILEKLPHKKTKVTSLFDVNPKGEVPEHIKKELLKKHGGRIGRIEEAMKNHYKK